MSEFEDILITEQTVQYRENDWINLFDRYENINQDSEEYALQFDECLDFKESKEDRGPMSIVSDTDDDWDIEEYKDKVSVIAIKRREIFVEKGLFEKLSFYDHSQGHSMNWMQSNYSQSFLSPAGFGHASVSHHRQEMSVFHFANNVPNLNGPMQFSNYFNNALVMQQNQPAIFFNPLMKNHSLEAINGINQSNHNRDLDYRQRSYSTDSFRKNQSNSNLRAIEDVRVKQSVDKTNGTIRSNYNSSFDDSEENISKHNTKKTKRLYKTMKTKRIPEAMKKTLTEPIVISSSDDDSDSIANKNIYRKNQIIQGTKNDVIKNQTTSVRTKNIYQNNQIIQETKNDVTNNQTTRKAEKRKSSSDSDKTLTEDNIFQSRKNDNTSKYKGEIHFIIYLRSFRSSEVLTIAFPISSINRHTLSSFDLNLKIL